MFGLPPSMRAQPLFHRTVARHRRARAARRAVCEQFAHRAASWPFSTNDGITHYYGVGAYQRPLDDVRRAAGALRRRMPCLRQRARRRDAARRARHDPVCTIRAGKRPCRATPAPAGISTTCATTICRRSTASSRRACATRTPQRYLELSRAVVAELMSDVFAEWRRAGSPCGGALVWQFQDLRPGAGWGIDRLHRTA